MADKYFNVKVGVKTGNITLDATTGNANVGNISVAGLANTANLFVRTYLESNLIPSGNGEQSLGTSTHRYKDFYLTGAINLNEFSIEANATTATFNGNIIANDAIFDSVTVNQTLEINSTINSTSTDTGALVTPGGVGIAKDLTVGGNINLAGGGTTPLGAIGYNTQVNSIEFKFT